MSGFRTILLAALAIAIAGCRASDKGEGKSTGTKVPAAQAPAPAAGSPAAQGGQDPLASGSGEQSLPPDQEFKASKPPVEITGAYLVAYRDPPSETEIGNDITVYVVLKDIDTNAVLPKTTPIETAEIAFANGEPRQGVKTPDPKVPYHVVFQVPRKSLIADSIGKDRLDGAISVKTAGLRDNDLKTSVVIWLANLSLQGEKVDYGAVMVRDPKAPPAGEIKLRVLASNHGETARDVRLTGLGDKLRPSGGDCPDFASSDAKLEQACDFGLAPAAVGNIERVLTLTYFNGIRTAHSSWPVKVKAVVVLGQAELDAIDPAVPFEAGTIATDGQRLLLTNANRLLVWSKIPEHSGVLPDLVVGQESLAEKEAKAPDARHFGASAETRLWGISVYTDGTRLFVADTDHARLLIWNTFPTSSSIPADVVLGQPDFTSTDGTMAGVTSRDFLPADVVVIDGKLLVRDISGGYDENYVKLERLLIWNEIPTMNHAPADVALTNVTTWGGLATDGTRLFAKSWGADQVSVWNAVPSASSSKPTFSLLRGLTVDDDVPSRTRDSAFDISVDREHGALITGVNRLLYWRQIPDRLDVPADFVLGQLDDSGNAGNAGGLSGLSLSGPRAAKLIGDRIVVSDAYNARVLIWPRPSSGDRLDASELMPASRYESGEAAAALLTVDGGSVFNFGPQAVGSEAVFQFGLRYSGSTPIRFVGVDGVAAPFSLLSGAFTGADGECPATVTASCLLTLRFAPLRPGVYRAPIRIQYDNGDGQHELVLSLHGEGRFIADTALGYPVFTMGGGQIDFDHGLWYLKSIHSDGQRLAVADLNSNVNQIEIWRTTRPAMGQAPDLRLRPFPQEDFDKDFGQVFVAGPRLFATSGGKILLWNTEPTSETQLPDLEIPTGGTGPSRYHRPALVDGLYFDGTRLFFADCSLGSIQIWNSLPTVSGVAADLVLKFPDIPCPTALTVANGRLIVVDPSFGRIGYNGGGGRVWIWSGVPNSESDLPVLHLGSGKPVWTTRDHPSTFGDAYGTMSRSGATIATAFASPTGIAWDGKHLFVADQENHRVLVWNDLPTANDLPPDHVIGQASPATNPENWSGLGPWSLSQPTAVCVAGNGLFVADQGNGRILRFDLEAWSIEQQSSRRD